VKHKYQSRGELHNDIEHHHLKEHSKVIRDIVNCKYNIKSQKPAILLLLS
jgi:hypothetical protein